MTLTTMKIPHMHIVCKKDVCGGKPIIKGTRTSITNVVSYHKLGLSPEEIKAELPHLNLAQIYDTLAYYYDNQKTIDGFVDEEMEKVVARKYPAGRY